MKRHCEGLILLAALLLQMAHCHAQSRGLLADPYPGAILLTNPSVTDPAMRKIMDARARSYYTTDPLEKVQAHYARLLGAFEEEWKSYIYKRAIVSVNEVYAIVTKRGGSIGEGGESFYGGAFAGVTLTGPPVNGTTNASVRNVYDALERAFAQRLQAGGEVDLEKARQHMEDPEI